jgi:hypothetical protein
MKANTNIPLRVLAISFYYPPASNPRAIQVTRLLRQFELPVGLICADHTLTNDRSDPSLLAESESHLQFVIRVPFTSPWCIRHASRLVDRFMTPFWEAMPDWTRHWTRPVITSVEKRFSELSDTVLVTFGSPMNDHLIGLGLKRRFNVPWVAHFSDPWIDNPFKHYNWFTKRANLKFEKEVITEADRLLFTSQETVDLVMAKYDPRLRSKIFVIPHSYEPEQYSLAANNAGSKIIIRFLGDMYGPRTPKPLFVALSQIMRDNPAILEDVCFEFMGSIDLDLKAAGLYDLPPGLIVLRDTVPNKESLSLMSSADGLMVIDAPAITSVFLPSKLIDYIGAGKPLLGITPRGTAWNLIIELGGWLADPLETAQVEQTVKSFIQYLRGRKLEKDKVWGEKSVRERFVVKAVAKRFEQLLVEVHEARVRANGATDWSKTS